MCYRRNHDDVTLTHFSLPGFRSDARKESSAESGMTRESRRVQRPLRGRYRYRYRERQRPDQTDRPDGPQSVLLRCCSWKSLESSQGRGPRMFFHSSKLISFIFCRDKTTTARFKINLKKIEEADLNCRIQSVQTFKRRFNRVCRCRRRLKLFLLLKTVQDSSLISELEFNEGNCDLLEGQSVNI